MQQSVPEKRLQESAGGAGANYAFIMAAARSGSTLLTYMIAAHPEAATIGETTGILRHLDVDEYRCSCGALILECGFWKEVTSRMNQRGLAFDVGDFGTRFLMPASRFTNRVLKVEHRGRFLEMVRDGILALSPAWRSRCREIVRKNEALCEVIREIHGARVFVDSSKHPYRLKLLLQIASMNIKVVYLVRDGRGVALSYMKSEGWPIGKAAVEWRRDIAASEKCLSRVRRDQVVLVRYEDYCTSLEPTLKRIFSFIGLDPEAKRPNFRAAGNHVIGNRMRLDATKEVCLDEQWKRVLTKEQLAVFDRVAGNVNRKYGYE